MIKKFVKTIRHVWVEVRLSHITTLQARKQNTLYIKQQNIYVSKTRFKFYSRKFDLAETDNYIISKIPSHPSGHGTQ